MRETYPQNLILCVQIRKKQFHAPGLKIHSVSANLALFSEKTLLSSARSAALGKTLEPRRLPNTEDLFPERLSLSPASSSPATPSGLPCACGSFGAFSGPSLSTSSHCPLQGPLPTLPQHSFPMARLIFPLGTVDHSLRPRSLSVAQEKV